MKCPIMSKDWINQLSNFKIFARKIPSEMSGGIFSVCVPFLEPGSKNVPLVLKFYKQEAGKPTVLTVGGCQSSLKLLFFLSRQERIRSAAAAFCSSVISLVKMPDLKEISRLFVT